MAGAFPATEAGARAIALAFYAAQQSDAKARVTTAYDAVTDPSCPCRKTWHTYIETLVRYDETVHGEGYHHVRADGFAAFPKTVQIAVTVDSASGTVTGPKGQLVERDPARKGVRDVLLLGRSGGSWTILSVTRISKGTA